jgi:methylase of polypeptide subunit release factors
VLNKNGAVGLELDPSQGDMVEAMLREQFPEAVVEIISDLAGHRRHVVMTR